MKQQNKIISVKEQLNDLKKLNNDWHYNHDTKYSFKKLDWLSLWYEKNILNVPTPYCYPMEDGQVEIEWDTNDLNFDIRLIVNLQDKTGLWEFFDLKTEEDIEVFMDMTKFYNVSWVLKKLNNDNDWVDNLNTPKVGVAAIVESPKRDKIIIIDRKYQPFGYAFPGGFMDIGEDASETAFRETLEETGVQSKPYALFRINSQPESDPRMHVVSIFVISSTEKGKKPKGNDDALKAFYMKYDDETLDNKFSKTYLEILNEYRAWRKNNNSLPDLG